MSYFETVRSSSLVASGSRALTWTKMLERLQDGRRKSECWLRSKQPSILRRLENLPELFEQECSLAKALHLDI